MPQKDRFSIKFKEKLERELSADESVLWMDEPAPIFAKNLFLIIVSVAFLFSLFAIDSFNAWTASLFAIIIVAVIILGSKVRFKKTLYVITNKRAIIIQKAKTYTIRSYPPHLLQFIYLTEKQMGIGDLIFEENISVTPSRSRKVQQFGFLNVRKVKLVEQMLRSLAAQESSNKIALFDD